MKRKHIEVARFHARTELLGQYDWRDMAIAANEHRPTERDALLREALRLKAQGLRPRDIAEILGLSPGAVEALLEGTV